MKNVVITGATSMIGVALIKECIKNNIQVLAIVRNNSSNINRIPKSSLIRIHECNLDELQSIDLEEDFDVFYHFAWDYTSKITRDNPVLQEKNIKYTLDAVELSYKLHCRIFIGAGSQAEYGRVDGVISEQTPLKPEIAYGMAKNAASMLSRKLCDKYNIIHIWARVFSVYGRYDNAGTLLTYAIAQFKNGQPASFSSATQPWDYLHESDAGLIFYLLGERVKQSGVYCVAKGESKPLRNYIEILCDKFPGTVDYMYAPDDMQAAGLQADITKLVNDIGYKPVVSFEEGIADMIEYLGGDI